MKIGIVIEDYELDQFDFLIGVEKGCLEVSKQNRKLDIAIGDFDSIDSSLINANQIIAFKPEKDYTDTYLAVKEALKYSNDITIIGGIQGGRIEHFIANINILNEFPFIKMIDKNSYIEVICDETRIINESSDYFSFFSLEDSKVTLKGFKYPLEGYLLKRYDSLAISNELLTKGEINVEGKVLVIKTKKSA